MQQVAEIAVTAPTAFVGLEILLSRVVKHSFQLIGWDAGIQRVARNCRLARAASESLSGVPRSSAAGSSSQEIEASEEIDGADGMLRIEEDEAGTQEAAERTGQRSDAGDANHSNPLLDKESGKDASMPYGGEQQPRKHHQAEGHVDRGSKGKGPTKTAAQVQRHQFEAMRPLKRKDVQVGPLPMKPSVPWVDVRVRHRNGCIVTKAAQFQHPLYLREFWRLQCRNRKSNGCINSSLTGRSRRLSLIAAAPLRSSG